MLTIDASVFINAAHVEEDGSPESLAFLKLARQRSLPTYSPTLLLVEVACSLSRVFGDPRKGIEFIQEMRFLPEQTWVPLDQMIADKAARLGAEQCLRGADAIYAAVAQHFGTTLVTVDKQQLDRLSLVMKVKKPAQVLSEY